MKPELVGRIEDDGTPVYFASEPDVDEILDSLPDGHGLCAVVAQVSDEPETDVRRRLATLQASGLKYFTFKGPSAERDEQISKSQGGMPVEGERNEGDDAAGFAYILMVSYGDAAKTAEFNASVRVGLV